MSSTSLQGSLDSFKLPDVLAFLDSAKKTGMLTVTAGQTTSEINAALVSNIGKITGTVTKAGGGALEGAYGFVAGEDGRGSDVAHLTGL